MTEAECRMAVIMYGGVIVLLSAVILTMLWTGWSFLPKFWEIQDEYTAGCRMLPIMQCVVMAELLIIVAVLIWGSLS